MTPAKNIVNQATREPQPKLKFVMTVLIRPGKGLTYGKALAHKTRK